MRNAEEPALNPDLWERLLALCDQHVVRFQWLKGHAGKQIPAPRTYGKGKAYQAIEPAPGRYVKARA